MSQLIYWETLHREPSSLLHEHSPAPVDRSSLPLANALREVMEPISTLALVSSIFQVVDFSINVLSNSIQIYRNGSTVQNQELTLVVDDLSSLNDKMKGFARPDLSHSGRFMKENQVLIRLVNNSEKIVKDLTLTLDHLRTKEQHTVFQTIVQALQTTWKAGEIEEKVKRLRAIRNELAFHTLVKVLEKVDEHQLKTEASLQSLDNTTKQIVENMLGNKMVTETQTLQAIERFERLERRGQLLEEKLETIKEHITRLPTDDMPTAQLTTEESIINFIKTRLDFCQRMDRHDGVEKAFKKTFQWVFQDYQDETKEWDSFSDWLSSSNNLYWISGKAGSGKSTLVKFLVQHPQFENSLEVWANGTPLIIVEHYFWNAGSCIQRSQEGLLRTLLFAILEEQPALARVLFPDRFQHGVDWSDFPTVPQMVREFNKLMTQTKVPAKFVLVIDGLDEYDTTSLNYTALADMFIEATKSPNIKSILSSRPLSAFELVFRSSPKLRLHDLTKRDIQTYVNDRLVCHERIAKLSKEDSAGAASLIADIVSWSSGVFLWVRLVTDSLLEGFLNHDTLEDLHARVKTIPGDIEELFERMLDQIPPQYKYQSSRIFQLIRFCNDISMNIFPDIKLTALMLHFSETSLENIMECPIRPLSCSEYETIEEEVTGRLRSRCAGLLEMSLSPVPNKIWPEGHVKYLHRTVADWIRKSSVWNRIIAGTANRPFFPSVTICRSLLMVLKKLPAYPDPNYRAVEIARKFLQVTKKSEVQTGLAQAKLLNECDRVMEYINKAYQDEQPNGEPSWKRPNWYEVVLEDGNRIKQTHHNLLSVAVCYGLNLYVEEMTRANGGVLPERIGMPLLHYVYSVHADAEVDMIKLLLEHGADPNERFRGRSPWQNFLLGLCEHRTVSKDWITLLRLCLRHGAKIDAHVDIHGEKYRMYRSNGPLERWEKTKMTVRDILQYVVTEDDPKRLTDETRIEVQELIQELDKGIPSIGESRCEVPIAQLKTEPVGDIDFTVKSTGGAGYESQKARKNWPGCHGRLRRRLCKIFKRDV